VGSLFSKAAIAQRLGNFVRKYDQNWFVRYISEAHGEDVRAGIGINDPLKQHAWVNISVFFLARNFARPPFRLMKGDTEIISGPVYKLLHHVNPQMSIYQLWEATEAWRKVAGEAFWVFDMFTLDKGKFPQTINIPSPRYMTEKVDENGEISMWIYENGRVKIPLFPSEMIHFMDWNAWNPLRGVNPLIAQDYELAQDFNANQNNLAILKNGSIPGGVLTNKGTGDFVSKDQASEIKERWEQKHRGPTKSGAVTVLGSGYEFQAIQETARDMEFFNQKKWNRNTILARYGVPKVLVDITDEKGPLSGSDTQSQMQNVWNNTLIPDQTFIEAKLKTDFFDRYRLDMTGEFDNSKLPELAEDKRERSDMDIAEVAAGIQTINQVKLRRGEDPVAWGDTWWVPSGMLPAEMAAQPRQPMIPPAKTVSVEALLNPPKAIESNPTDNEIYKTLHWKTVVKYWEALEQEYTKALRKWFFAQRSYLLEQLISKEVNADDLNDWIDFSYWLEQEAQLRDFSKPLFAAAVVETGDNVFRLFTDMGIVFDAPNWSIMNTGAIAKIETRLTNIGGVVKTIRDHVGGVVEEALREGLSEKATAELLRNTYNIASNRAPTIARTEIGGVIMDARDEAFKDVGIEYTEWSSSRDAKVRATHQIDGEIVAMGETFSNGLLYPNDPAGPAEEVVNCRCINLPVKPEDAE